METTGADANEEFARWLAETAKAGQTADQATSAKPGAPAAPPPTAPPGAMPPPPPSAGQPVPPSPEFFGADQLASPPTRPYEAPFAGPQIARTSFQPAAGDPPLPPAPTPPPAAPVAPLPPAPPAPPAAPLPPAAGPAAPPAWAPGYAGAGAEVPAAEPPAAAPPPPADSTPFFPPGDAAPVGFPPAPPPSAAPPAFPPLDSQPVYGSDPGAPGAPVPPSFPPVAPEPPAAPIPPAAPEPPQVPSYAAPYAQPAPVPPAAPSSDPFGALFDAGAADTAARLAASPPPGAEAPPLAAPPVGERPADEDPLSSLFGGLHTAEAPVAPTADLFESTPVAPAAPVYTPEPAFTVEPVLPPAPTIASEQPQEPATASAPGAAYAQTFSSSTPPPDDDPTAGTQFFGGGTGDYEEPPDLDRTTVGEKVAFVLAFILPPVGLIGSIVAASQSARRRGWVHGFVRAGLVISIVTTIAAGVAGAYGYKMLEDQRRHDSLVDASVQFCATIAEQPGMIDPPTFGFPGPGASIPETLESIQAYIDRWDALATKSPSGIRTDVTRVADAARDIYETIDTTRLVNNELNVANMTSVAESTRIPAWQAQFC